MKNNFLKFDLKSNLISAFIIAPTLAVMLISTVYQMFASQSGLIKSGFSLSMSLLTAVAITAGLVLAVVNSKHIVPIVYALIFGLGFVSYLIIVISGTSNVAEDAFFEMMMLIFTLPLMSFMSIPSVLSVDRAPALLVISAIITAISITVAIYIVIKEKREAERRKIEEAERIKNAEKAKAKKSRRRRGEVR